MNISFVWGLLLGLLLGAAGVTLITVYLFNGQYFDNDDEEELYYDDSFFEEEQQ